jgi:hypothetical protein
MTAPDLTPEFLALPLGRNGLPDLLILNKTYSDMAKQGTVHACIVSSDQGSDGYWAELFRAQGELALKWARQFALEKARQHVVSQRSSDPQWEPKPIEFHPFESWDALAVQRELGLYPMLPAVGGLFFPVLKVIHDKLTAYEVTVTPMHYNLK